MAEFCLDCWNKLNESFDSERKYILSKELYLCEGCNEYKSVIIMERKAYYIHKFRFFIFPFKIIFILVYIAWRLLILPYLIFKYVKLKNKHN